MALGSKVKIYLNSYKDRAFPNWIKKLDNNFELIFKKSSLLAKEEFLTTHQENGFDLKISSGELAILEYIEMLDLSGSLETAENYAQSLQTLRSDVLQRVLESSHSIKAKRIFLYLAEKLNLPVYKNLKLSKINLGSGKRVVVIGWELDKKYQITVDRKQAENPF